MHRYRLIDTSLIVKRNQYIQAEILLANGDTKLFLNCDGGFEKANLLPVFRLALYLGRQYGSQIFTYPNFVTIAFQQADIIV